MRLFIKKLWRNKNGDKIIRISLMIEGWLSIISNVSVPIKTEVVKFGVDPIFPYIFQKTTTIVTFKDDRWIAMPKSERSLKKSSKNSMSVNKWSTIQMRIFSIIFGIYLNMRPWQILKLKLAFDSRCGYYSQGWI